MKAIKKMVALMLAFMMCLTMGGFSVFAADDPALAATTSYDHPLKVTGLTKGDVAHFYHVVKWDPNAKGNVSGWVATDAFKSVLTEAVLKEILVGEPAVPDDPDTAEDESKPAVPAKGITSELAGQLARIVGAADPAIAKTDVTVTGTEAEFDNPAEGIYMALITPIDVDTVYNPVFVSADFNKTKKGEHEVTEAASYSDESAAKKSTVELNKTASTTEDSWDDAKWTTTAIGDTVSYTVTTTIPGYGEVYTNPVFKITDKLTDLKLKADTVTLVKPAGLTKGTDYTVTASDTGYTIEFKADYLKTLIVPTDVEVKYDAIVTTTAPVHVNTEKNEVSTEFSHNPSDERDHGFKKDTTQHYTFTIDAEGLGCDSTQSGKKTSEIVKVGKKADGTPITETRTTSQIDERQYVEGPLAGAKFKLYTDANATKEYIPKKTDGTPGTALAIESCADGRMKIEGLDAGTYYLKETEAPAGYVADQTIHKIVISANTQDVDVTEYTTDGETWISQADYDKKSADEKKAYKSYKFKTAVLKSYSITIDDKPVSSYSFTNKGTDADIVWSETGPTEIPFPITNTQGTELPSTGGIGTIIFYVLGTILVLGSAIVLISKRRMQNR